MPARYADRAQDRPRRKTVVSILCPQEDFALPLVPTSPGYPSRHDHRRRGARRCRCQPRPASPSSTGPRRSSPCSPRTAAHCLVQTGKGDSEQVDPSLGASRQISCRRSRRAYAPSRPRSALEENALGEQRTGQGSPQGVVQPEVHAYEGRRDIRSMTEKPLEAINTLSGPLTLLHRLQRDRTGGPWLHRLRRPTISQLVVVVAGTKTTPIVKGWEERSRASPWQRLTRWRPCKTTLHLEHCWGVDRPAEKFESPVMERAPPTSFKLPAQASNPTMRTVVFSTVASFR